MLDDSKIEQFVLLAKGARGKALVDIINNATSEPGLFGFGELLLAMPQIQDISNGESAAHYQLLQLFAYGTWPDYASAPSGTLPPLNPAQLAKLKQLTVVSLALQQKVLSYTALQQALQIDSVRALEDFLITECFYTGLLQGKLDQKAACVQVHDVVGRDVRPEQLPLLQQGLNTWLGAAESLLSSLEARVSEAVGAAQAAQKRAEASAARIAEMKTVVKADMELRNTEMMLDETGGLEFNMDEERMDRAGVPAYPPMRERDGPGGHGDRAERRLGAARSKKRIQR